ncbi:MAG: glycosyltransferase [Treponema sp.]|nr:glycosyltransferase [Treponema sp.]
MNIALFTDSYLPTKSGIVTVVLQHRKILEDMGHHVVVVTVNTKEEEKALAEREKDENVLRIRSVRGEWFGVPDQYIGFPHEKKILKFLKKHNVQLIHSHTEFFVAHAAKLSGKKLHIPVIATTHTLWEDFYKYYLLGGRLIPVKLIRKIVKRLYKKFYALINVSQKARDYFKMPFMLPNTPSAIIPNALDTDSFLQCSIADSEIQKVRKQWGIKKDDIVFLFLGRVVEEKRVDELLDICMRVIQKNSKIKILFVGAGPAVQSLEKRARPVSDRIIFTGYVPWTEVHSYYQLGDVFITASLSEMHSMTVLEALVSGLPLIARRDTSFSDTIFDGKNGYMADTDEEMDQYFLELAADKKKRAAFGEYSKKVAKSFSLEVYGKRVVAFYQKILDTFPEKITDEDLKAAVDSVAAFEE